MNLENKTNPFKKDMLDKCKLKNAKRRFKQSDQAKSKPRVIKIS